MRSGRLRHFVEVRRLTETVGPDGGITQSFGSLSPPLYLFAEVKPVRGKEYMEAKAVQGENVVMILCRNPGIEIRQGDRIVEKPEGELGSDGMQYDIEHVSDVMGHGRDLEIAAVRYVGHGV